MMFCNFMEANGFGNQMINTEEGQEETVVGFPTEKQSMSNIRTRNIKKGFAHSVEMNMFGVATNQETQINH